MTKIQTTQTLVQLFTTILFVSAFSVSANSQSFTRYYRGFIGENAVKLTLKRDKEKLSGSYINLKDGKEHILLGNIVQTDWRRRAESDFIGFTLN